MDWVYEVTDLIFNQNIIDAPNDRIKAEEVNKYLLFRNGSNGIVCEFDDYLASYEGAAKCYSRSQPSIAMNIDAYTDQLVWSKYVNFPDDIITSRDILKTGLFGSHYGIPIVVNNKIKTKIH